MPSKKDIEDLRATGLSFHSIGKIFNISRQRAHQILHKPFAGQYAKLHTRNYKLYERHIYHLRARRKGLEVNHYKPCAYCARMDKP